MNEFLNIYDIKRYVDNKDFKSGLNIFNAGDVEVKVTFNEEMNFFVFESVVIHNGKPIDIYTNIKQNPSNQIFEIKDAGCSCIKGDRCEHIAAVLIKLSKHSHKEIELMLKGETTQKVTTSKILMLEQKILDRYINATTHDTPQYEIEPVLFFNYGKVFVEFKIGNVKSHLYSITNVYDFYQRFETNETFEYSSRFSCTHNLEYLVDNIPGLNDFLIAKIRANKNFIDGLTVYNSTSNHSKIMYDKRYVELTENDLGLLLQFYNNKNLHIKYLKKGKYVDHFLHCKFDDLRITLDIKKKKKNYVMSVCDPTEYTYYGDQSIISIVGKELIVTKINNLEDSQFLNLVLNEDITVDINEFDRLYDNLIKDRLKFIKLVDTCNFKESEIDVIDLKLYIDLNKRGHIVIKKKLQKGKVEIAADEDEFSKRKKVLALNDLLGDKLVRDKYVISKPDDIFNFYNETILQVQEIATDVYLSEEFKQVKVINKPKITTGVKLESNLLKIDLQIDDCKIDELKKLFNAYTEKKKYFKLKNGDFITLDNEEFKELEKLIDGMSTKDINIENGEIKVDRYNAIYIDEILTQSKITRVNRDEQFLSLLNDITHVKTTNFDVPDDLNATLRNYQIEGFKFLSVMKKNGFGAILADDMGLGKTIQIIALLLNTKGPNLVVCPSSLVLNWANEIIKFAPCLSVGLLKDNKENRIDVLNNYKKFDILITSYDTLKRDIELYADLEFTSIIIDEAQYIKNPNTKGSKSVKEVNAKHHFALTGTPIENNLTELWSIFDFILPTYLSTYYSFHKNYEYPIVKDQDNAVKQELINQVTPFILRRMKGDVLKELPEKMETIMYCEFEEEQQQLYDAHILQFSDDLNRLEKDESNNKIEILSMLMKLRQICCDPSLILEDEKISSAKLALAMELIENSIEAGHKILLFSQFTSMLDIIKEKLIEKDVNFHMLTGAMSSTKRMKTVDEFNNDDSDVFLISLKAGGTGLNLTKADVVIHFDPWWNVSSENQATDRAHRIGQKNKVNVYKLIAKNTIEEKIIEIQDSKRKLSDSIIKDVNNPLSTMNKEDIRKLIIGD